MNVGGNVAMSDVSPPNNIQNQLEILLFKATNPANKVEDVNTIKRFCDQLSKSQDGPMIASRLLSHKIQSPQEREAIQALAVVEAAAKSSPAFVAEIAKFRFLNEMIKLVSPKYLGPRTPNTVKQKVVELLYSWTRELSQEKKIQEAYDLLKTQGVITQDPEYVGGAVFAASLPPRKPDLSLEDQGRLQKLLRSSNPEDLEKANNIIKGMVKKEEEKLERASRISSLLQEVQSSTKLLGDMLDQEGEATSEERELMGELHSGCERLRPSLFRMAAETEENDPIIGDILYASDEMSRVMEKYKEIIVLGKKKSTQQSGLNGGGNSLILEGVASGTSQMNNTSNLDLLTQTSPLVASSSSLLTGLDSCPSIARAMNSTLTTHPPSGSTSNQSVAVGTNNISPAINDDDLLKEGGHTNQASLIPDFDMGSLSSTLPSAASTSASGTTGLELADLLTSPSSPSHRQEPHTLHPQLTQPDSVTGSESMLGAGQQSNNSRARGLEELDMLGESVLRQHLPDNSVPNFQVKKQEKMSMAELMKQRSISVELDTKQLTTDNTDTSSSSVSGGRKPQTNGQSSDVVEAAETAKIGKVNEGTPGQQLEKDKNVSSHSASQNTSGNPNTTSSTVQKLSDIALSMSDVLAEPERAPQELQSGSSSSLSVTLYHTKNCPRPGVSVYVVQMANTSPSLVEEIDFKPAVPKGCRVRMLPPSTSSLAPPAPFSPPTTSNQIMLVSSPEGSREVSLSYVLSYSVDEEPFTDLGKDVPLAIINPL